MQEMVNSSLLAVDGWGKEAESPGANYVTISHRPVMVIFFLKYLSQSVLELPPEKSVLAGQWALYDFREK